MAFFSKKKKEQPPQQSQHASGPANGAMSPTPGAGPSSGPSMFLAQRDYNQMPGSSYQEPHQPHYMQAAPTNAQSLPSNLQGPTQIFGGSIPLSNGVVGSASPTPYLNHATGSGTGGGYPQQGQYPNGPSSTSPQSLNYPNGTSGPPRPFANAPAAANGHQSSVSGSSSNGSLGGLPPSLSASQQQQSSAAPGQPGSAPSSHPVTYPWSQRQVRLMPVQPMPNQQGQSAPQPDTVSPFPRYGHSINPVAQSSNGDLYLFGGLVKEQVRNDLYVISCAAINAQGGTSTDSKVLAQSPINVTAIDTRGEIPCPRVGHASVSVGNVLIVWGGDTKTREEDPQDDNLYLLNLGSRDWTLVKVTGQSPQGRYGHAAAMRGGKFYIFGGQQDVPMGAPDEDAFLNDLWCFDLQNLKAGKPHWTQIEYAQGAPIPPKRTGHTMVNYGDSLYIFGGTDGQYHYNDTWCFNTSTCVWSELSCIGYIPVPREGHASTLVDDVVYVFGGRSVDGKDLEDLAAFKISNQRWYMFTNMGPAPSGRSGHAMAAWQNKVFVLGGESYTSRKHEWPDMVHMLDTGKIKYPSDSRLGNRKSSNPKMNNAPNQPSQSQQQQLPNKNVQQVVTDEQRKAAASPTGSDREASKATGLNNSLNKSLPNGVSGSPSRGGPSPTPRQTPTEDGKNVRRPSDVSRRAMSPINEQPSLESSNRALSPNGQNYIAPSSSLQSMQTFSTPPTRTQASMNGPSMSPAPAHNLNALRGNARSPSPIQGQQAQEAARSLDSYALQDHQAQSRTPTQGRPDDLTALKQRDRWMQAALASAVRQGFTMPDEHSQGQSLDSQSGNAQLVQAFLTLRQELSSLKASMQDDIKQAEDQQQQANQGRALAVQEAAFYRSKIAALESNSSNDLYKLERGRIADLERRVAEIGSVKSNLERRVEELESELDHHRDAAQLATERETAHLQRADAAEAAYSRSLTDYAELQRRAHSNESSLQDYVSKHTTLESQLAQITAQHNDTSSKLKIAETALDQHVGTHEQSKITLVAANNHAREMEELWTQSQQEATQHQERAIQLDADLQQKSQLLEAAHARIDNLERALETMRQESHSLRDLSSGQFTDLLSSHREYKEKEAEADSVVQQQLQAAKLEADRHRDMAKDAQTRYGSAQNELREARMQHVGLEKQVSLLRTELAGLRSRHASALEASSRAQALIFQRDLDLRERSRAIEAAEVRAGLLKSILSENGLATDENGSPSMKSGESSSSMSRKIAELESRLEQRNQANQELQGMHDEARQEAESSRHRLRISEDQIDELSSQVEQLRVSTSGSPKSGEAVSRAEKAEQDLQELQEKHQQLDATHSKAVQYVKGMEKMFRRMKDELTKYKERNEALEAEVANKSPSDSSHSRERSSDLRPELDTLRTQLAELRQQSEQSNSQNEELQNHIKKLKADYDTNISQQQSSHSTRLTEAENEIDHVQEALEKTQAELEETLTLNKQLNAELQNAMKRSQSPGSQASEPWAETKRKLEQDLSSAMTKSEWLKRENAALEERCRESESKVTLLLDHIESSGGVEAVASSVGHSAEHDDERWKGRPAETRSDARSEEGSDYSHSLDSFQQRPTASAQSNGR